MIIALAIWIGKLAKQKKEEREEKEINTLLSKELKDNKDTPFVVSDRVRGHIKDSKFLWIRVEGRPYARLSDLLASEELDEDELNKLKMFEAHLATLREYRKQKCHTPTGYRVFIDVIVGEIRMYNLGIKLLGGRNHMAVELALNEAKDMYIHRVYLSVDLTTQIHRVYEITSKEGYEMFKKEVMETEDIASQYAIEIERLEEIKSELQHYNKQRHHLSYNEATKALEYRPVQLGTKIDFTISERI
jgi:hypothetical protein